MAARVSWDDVEVGTALPALELRVHRVDLVRYAGASGDFNVLHWNERLARRAGLPDVVAHGMYTMAQAARVVTDWVGDPGAVVSYHVRFSRPVVVPDDDEGTVVTFGGTVEEKLGDKRVKVLLTARTADGEVLTGARAVVALG